MATTVTGVVKNGVVVLDHFLPENATVEVSLRQSAGEQNHPSPSELRKMPRTQRQAILEAAAILAEEDYRNDKELTGFEAYSEEELDDDNTDSAAS